MRIPSTSERKKTSELMKQRWQDPEYRKQMSEKHKGQKVSEEGRKSRSEALKGIKRSEETKRKMSKSAKTRAETYYEAMREGHKRWMENETVSERMERLQGWMQAGREARINKDYLTPSFKLVVECNGDYWHNLPERKERDKMLKEYVESTGRRIVFIWEHEIKDAWFRIEDYLKGGDAQ